MWIGLGTPEKWIQWKPEMTSSEFQLRRIPLFSVPFDSSRKDVFKTIEVYGINYSFQNISHFQNRKWPFYHLELS